jgi:D-beta-D-heptose 7-phosphate kinase/D-beta-D-heptose 1-phosphate adenosyltransferase
MDRARLESLADSLAERVERFSSLRLLVVGDALLDEYLWGDAQRVSPEAPVPIVHVRAESTVLGGAANVVRNAVALGAACDFCCAIGDDAAGEQILAQLEALGVSTQGVVRVGDRPTTQKTRLVARSQQIVRFDREHLDPLPEAAGEQLVEAFEAACGGADAVVIEDYGKGLLEPALARRIVRSAREGSLPIFLDPKGELAAFEGVRLVKPNLSEAEALSGLRAESAGIEALGRELQKQLPGSDVAISRGGSGLAIFEGDAPMTEVPTARREVFDVQGAGDTLITCLALARRAGASLVEAAWIANAAAAVVVGKSGTATVDPGELRAALPEVLAAAGELT